jgi:prolipoprotein diacylglyceryltransferase
MLIHPQINPVALQLGPLAIHWYGLTYLAAFGLFFFLATLRLRHQPYVSITGPGAWSRKDIEDILFLGVMGVVVGGRLGYCLFYKPGYYLSHPLEILAVWQGGMSFHGGMLGVLVSQLWFYARKPRKTGQVSGAFLLGYGVFRFIAEFFREPDEFLGILALGMSMGQWLCVPMIAGGAGLWVWASKRPQAL